MKTTAPTAMVNSIRVTNAKAAYQRRLYFTPELLQTERDEREGRKEEQNVNKEKGN